MIKILGMLAVAFLVVLGPQRVSYATSSSQDQGIVPIDKKPFGQTYGEWAVRWWQWAASIPASVNPREDTSGANCMVGQDGPVWFLAGTGGTSQPGAVTRSCTLFSDRAIFFPIINAFYGAFTTDPPEQKTVEFLRAQVHCTYQSVRVRIDGRRIAAPRSYLVRSPLFDLAVPEENIFGVGSDVIPGLILTPSVDQGLYLFLRPLSPGDHTIRWTATQECPFGSFTQDVTYNLKVRRPYRPN